MPLAGNFSAAALLFFLIPKINGFSLTGLRAPLFLKYFASAKEPRKSVVHLAG